MVDRASRNGRRALADRKGATALEYALIIVAAAGPLMVGMHAFTAMFRDYLAGIGFS